ncbi:unnamed protein product, partial [Meganyctiphanes norvegica]
MHECVSVVEVTEDNFKQLWPAIQNAIKGSSFVAMDLELSGLGDRKKLNYPEVDLRYQFSAEITRTHAVISMGLSCFTCRSLTNVHVPNKDSESTLDSGSRVCSHDYLVQTFNILLLCSDSYIVEPDALKFLLSHGFDFNKQYAKGVTYHRGPDKNEQEWPNVRQVFSTIVKHGKPVVLHNGLIDLMFLYQSFYTDLPMKADTFAADLNDMFTGGVYDTKYIAEYTERMPATYLEYLYKKMQLRNAKWCHSGSWHVRVSFPPYPTSMKGVEWAPYLQVLSYTKVQDDDGLALCQSFAFHGWCKNGTSCEKSHQLDKIAKDLKIPSLKKSGKNKNKGPGVHQGSLSRLMEEFSQRSAAANNEAVSPSGKELQDKNAVSELKKEGKSKQNNDCEKETNRKRPFINIEEASEDTDSSSGNGTLSNQSGHRAGFDAFMTGYIFACHIAEAGKLETEDKSNEIIYTKDTIGLMDSFNKVYLMGKSFPFLIRTGGYAKMSQNHINKIKNLRS